MIHHHIEIEKNGDPATKVDFLILGDGYTAAERGKFEKDARRLLAILPVRSISKWHSLMEAESTMQIIR